MNDISVILPSYKPDEKLLETVKSFEEAGFDDIICMIPILLLYQFF